MKSEFEIQEHHEISILSTIFKITELTTFQGKIPRERFAKAFNFWYYSLPPHKSQTLQCTLRIHTPQSVNSKASPNPLPVLQQETSEPRNKILTSPQQKSRKCYQAEIHKPHITLSSISLPPEEDSQLVLVLDHLDQTKFHPTKMAKMAPRFLHELWRSQKQVVPPD